MTNKPKYTESEITQWVARMESSGMTDRQLDFEILDMMVSDPDELADIMTPEEIQEMKDYLAKKKNKRKEVHKCKRFYEQWTVG